MKMEEILEVTSTNCNVSKDLIKSRSRELYVVRARHVFTYISNVSSPIVDSEFNVRERSLSMISRFLGKKTHVSTLIAVRKIDDYISLGDDKLINDILNISKECLSDDEYSRLYDRVHTSMISKSIVKFRN